MSDKKKSEVVCVVADPCIGDHDIGDDIKPLLEQGYTVIRAFGCPSIASGAWKFINDESDKINNVQVKRLIQLCDLVYVINIDNEMMSNGMFNIMAYAAKLDKPIKFLNEIDLYDSSKYNIDKITSERYLNESSSFGRGLMHNTIISETEKILKSVDDAYILTAYKCYCMGSSIEYPYDPMYTFRTNDNDSTIVTNLTKTISTTILYDISLNCGVSEYGALSYGKDITRLDLCLIASYNAYMIKKQDDKNAPYIYIDAQSSFVLDKIIENEIFWQYKKLSPKKNSYQKIVNQIVKALNNKLVYYRGIPDKADVVICAGIPYDSNISIQDYTDIVRESGLKCSMRPSYDGAQCQMYIHILVDLGDARKFAKDHS